jgi:hypothetical protein
MPRRPAKAWFRSCVSAVERHGGAIDPRRVCGAQWKKKSSAEKRVLTMASKRKKSRKKKHHHRTSGNGTATPRAKTGLRLTDDLGPKARKLRSRAAKMGLRVR